MALIVWNNMYSVNVAEIDEQHKKIVDLINLLHDSIRSGEKNQVLAQIYNELIAYTILHFNHEEMLMRKANYPDLIEHQEVHKSIVEQVKRLKQAYAGGSQTALNDTLEFLRNWLLKHIAGTDKKYTSTMNAAGIK